LFDDCLDVGCFSKVDLRGCRNWCILS